MVIYVVNPYQEQRWQLERIIRASEATGQGDRRIEKNEEKNVLNRGKMKGEHNLYS